MNIRPFHFLFLTLITTANAAEIRVQRHENCNLFDLSEPVKFDVKLSGFPSGRWNGKAEIVDYHGKRRAIPLGHTIDEGKPASLTLEAGKMEPGYYELRIGGDGAESKMMSFGVVEFVDRTAQQARKEGSRFGLKTFSIGEPGVWWRKGEVWNLSQVVDACAKLGLQWTRHQFNQGPSSEPGMIGTDDLIKKHAMNVVLKVEGFPEHCFDTSRYGSLEEWKAKKKNKIWNRCTVPLKDPYQKWLKEEIAKIPEDQNIYEIGNEVWNYMTAEEFAEWAKMSVEAIKEARPNAKVGADPGGAEYGRKFIAAGGMDNMEIWYSHPYSFTPLPEHRIRGYLRNQRDILKRRTGRDFELFITEYGWPIAPEDTRKHSVSEKVQAQRTTRQSLMLYAEDAKTLIPHWMGDREQDPKEREHWFGFFRLNQQPLPVVIAHATCARMIDSGKFVGDLWLGPGIGAMMFERDGVYTLGMWTAEEPRKVEVDVAAPEIKIVSIMGGATAAKTHGGKVTLELNGDVVYLVGVGQGLLAKVSPPGSDLNPDLWSTREGEFKIAKAATPPEMDGKLGEWLGTEKIILEGASGSGYAMLKWTNSKIYAAFAVQGYKPGSKEEFEFALGVRPDRQVDMSSTTIYDFAFKVKHLGPVNHQLVVENADFDAPKRMGAGGKGLKWAALSDSNGWTAELEIPVEFLSGIPKLSAGTKLSGYFAVRDLENKKVLLSKGNQRPRLWSYLTLSGQ